MWRVGVRGKLVDFFFSSRRRHTRFDCDWSSTCALPISNSCALIERANGTAVVALGGGTPGVGGGGATGKIYQLSDTQLSDDGAAIPSYYTTHFFPERAVEQALALGAHRKLFSYLTLFVEGAGNLSLTSFTDSSRAAQAQQPLALSSPALKDLDRKSTRLNSSHSQTSYAVFCLKQTHNPRKNHNP